MNLQQTIDRIGKDNPDTKYPPKGEQPSKGTQPIPNYQKQMEQIIAALQAEGKRPRLLLHVCCAPCSSGCLQQLTAAFDVTLWFYNPNISPESEYRFRLQELERLITEMSLPAPVKLARGEYEPERFYAVTNGMENLPEGGERCRACYRLRLSAAARAAAQGGYAFFCTTLSISPHKNAQWLNRIGGEEGEKAGVRYLFSDFKKKGGYADSIQKSKEYHLYRQDYCGCIYSKAEAQRRREQVAKEALCGEQGATGLQK